MVKDLNQYLKGWLGYFRLAACKEHLQHLDEWIRRKLRCVQLKQGKRNWTIAQFLIHHGVPAGNAWCMAASGKGWWRKARTPQAHQAMNLAWFAHLGLINLTQQYVALQQ